MKAKKHYVSIEGVSTEKRRQPEPEPGSSTMKRSRRMGAVVATEQVQGSLEHWLLWKV